MRTLPTHLHLYLEKKRDRPAAKDETRGIFIHDGCLDLIDHSFFPPSFGHDGKRVTQDLRKLECVSRGCRNEIKKKGEVECR